MFAMIFNPKKDVFKTSQGDIGHGTTIFHWPHKELVAINELEKNYNQNIFHFDYAEIREIYEWEAIFKNKGIPFTEAEKHALNETRQKTENQWKKDYSNFPVVRYAKPA
jgi:hypothetical protein